MPIVPEYSPYTVQTRREDGCSDMYGSTYWAAAYAGVVLPDKYYYRGLWQHGCFPPWSNVFGAGCLTYKTPGAVHLPMLVGTQSQAEVLRKAGYPYAQAIGSPINYAPCENIKRKKGSLLVMPTHTLPFDTYNDRTSFLKYAAEIKSVAHHFTEVVICVHPSCMQSGFWVDEFKQYGFEIIHGAAVSDRNALVRMRSLFAQFEVVTTNGWGSHVAYALAGGARVSIWGEVLPITPEVVSRDPTWNDDPAAVAYFFSKAYTDSERAGLGPFMVPPQDAVADIATGRAWVGADNMISPAQMRDLLETVLDPGPGLFYSQQPDFGAGLKRLLFVVDDARDIPANRRLLELLVWLRRIGNVGFDVLLLKKGPLDIEFHKYATLFSLDDIKLINQREHTYQMVYTHGLGASSAVPLLTRSFPVIVASIYGDIDRANTEAQAALKLTAQHACLVLVDSIDAEAELIYHHGVPASLIKKATDVGLEPSMVYEYLASVLAAGGRSKHDAPSGSVSDEEVAFSHDDRVSCLELIKDYQRAPDSVDVSTAVAELNSGLVDFITNTPVDKLKGYCEGNFGVIFRALVASGFNTVGPSADGGRRVAGEVASKSGTTGVRALLVGMLQQAAHWGGEVMDFNKVPTWLLDDYLKYLFYNPQVFVVNNEAELYFKHLTACARLVHQEIVAAPDSPLAYKLAEYFSINANCIPLYFTRANTRAFMETRAAIIEFMLKKKGAAIDAVLLPRPKTRKKIKVGILSSHFGPQTETHVTLPSLQIDRDKFELCLFAVHQNPSPIEEYARSWVDSFTVLPKDLHQQVRVIRDALLDVIVIGTNLTAVTNQSVLLALHRLAPIQLVNYCSPVSTGIRNIDGFLSGTFNDFPGLQDHFSEQLHFCEGAPGCLDYTVEKAGSGEVFSREKVGVAPEEVLFINAAACYKILPEMQDIWARILKEVPGSRLLLLPFNPNWSNAFPVKQFERSLTEIFARHGLGRDRFILANSLPSRADVKEIEKIADVYLDTVPFSGSISVIDPLEVGLPVVVCDGDTHRARMAAALLLAINTPELITHTEADYIQLAVRLGRDASYRAELSQKLLAEMAAKPKFINAKAYAQDLGRVIESLHQRRG